MLPTFSLARLAAVVDQETGLAGEFVRLDRDHLDQEFLVGHVGPGQG
jgi:hypothetical protein